MSPILPEPEVGNLNSRVVSTVKKYGVLPFYALQYRLCEAGSSRPDPRLIRLALAELADQLPSQRGDAHFTEVELIDSTLYADGSATEVEKLAAKSALIEALSSICAPGNVTPIAALEDAARSVFPTLSERAELEGRMTRRITSGLTYHCESILLDAASPIGVPISLWITHDLEWLYPDDWRLWEFLRLSTAAGRSPILIARKVSPATFSVLKAVGARGVQYYSFLSAADPIGRLTELAQEIGWIHTMGAQAIADHRAVGQLDIAVEAAQAPNRVAEQQIEEAMRLGLAEASTADASRLKLWAQSVGLTAPPVFWTALDRWTESRAIAGQLKSTVGESDPLSTVQSSVAPKPLGFGRKSQVSRVPFTLR